MSFGYCHVCKNLFSFQDGFNFPLEFWHKCKEQKVQSYGIVGFQEDEIASAIKSKYGDDGDKLTLAEQVGVFAGEFSRQNPVGSREERQAKRLKRREYRRTCRRYLEEKSKDLKPVGMISGFLFMTVIGAIISFFVQMLMRKYFEDENE